MLYNTTRHTTFKTKGMDTIKAVLTGDVIQSRKLNNENIEKVLNALRGTFSEIQDKILTKEGHFEIYRGDSFQVLLHEPHLALKVALILKSRLRSLFKPVIGTSVVKSDARIAIGIGTMRLQNIKIIESHGEAFELSGTELDKIIKESLNLSIRTPWEEVNEELRVNCLFADNTINNWSVKTAESVFRYLLYDEIQDIQAKYFKVSQPAISKRFAQGNMKAMDAFNKRFEKIIESHTK